LNLRHFADIPSDIHGIAEASIIGNTYPKENAMTKAELIATLKDKAGLATKAQAETVYDSLFTLIADTLKKGDSVAAAIFASCLAALGSILSTSSFLAVSLRSRASLRLIAGYGPIPGVFACLQICRPSAMIYCLWA
jgi:hypothetical protein